MLAPHELERRFAGLRSYAGLDLASVNDLTALTLVFPIDDRVHVLPYIWVPDANLRDRENRDRVPYRRWIDEGYIRTTSGNATDYRVITKFIIDEVATRFNLREVAYDRWGAPQVAQELTDAGIEVFPTGQGYASLSAPTKFLQEIVLQRRLCHYANPVLRWQADCMTVIGDPAGNLKPRKPERHKSSKRIDSMVALIMALSRLMVNMTEPPEPSMFWM